MNRELTRREKTLLLVLIVVVLVAGYCKLILIPINDQISSYRLNMEAEQTELDANQGKMAQMQKMQKAIDEIKAAGEKRTIPQYDNSGKLMIELHEIMSDTLDYSLDCSAGTVQQDYIMLRPIVMTFRTSTYAQARQIVDRLCSSENISQISDMNMNTYTEGRNSGTVETMSGLVVSYVSQNTDHLRGSLTEFVRTQGLDGSRFRTILRKLDVPREQFEKDLADYSSGQKKKVLLARSLCQSAHLYVWDEPLNFIDVISRMQVEDLLLACRPTLLFVEHDARFCDEIATRRIRIQRE